MSYRHSSYRKMSRAVTASFERKLTGPEMDRVLHWSNQSPLPKPPSWGRPKRKRCFCDNSRAA